MAGPQEVAQQPGAGLGVRLLGPGGGDLAVHLGELLGGQTGIVGADEEIGAGPEALDTAFGLLDLAAQAVDLAREPLAGIAGLAALVRLLGLDELGGDHVGGLGGERRVLRIELDGNDSRLVDLIGRQLLEIAAQHALLGGHAHRILGEAEEGQHLPDRIETAQGGIEFRLAGEVELLCHGLGDVAGENQLDLAENGLLIDGRPVGTAGAVAFGTGEGALAVLDENAGLGAVGRSGQADGGEAESERCQGRSDNPEARRPEGAGKTREVEIDQGSPVATCRCRVSCPDHDAAISCTAHARRIEIIRVAIGLIGGPKSAPVSLS